MGRFADQTGSATNSRPHATPTAVDRTKGGRRGFGSRGTLGAAAGFGAVGAACLAAAGQIGAGGVIADSKCVNQSCADVLLVGEGGIPVGCSEELWTIGSDPCQGLCRRCSGSSTMRYCEYTPNEQCNIPFGNVNTCGVIEWEHCRGTWPNCVCVAPSPQDPLPPGLPTSQSCNLSECQ